MDLMNNVPPLLQGSPWLVAALQIGALLLALWLASTLARSLLVRAVTRAVQATPTVWDDALLSPGLLARLSRVVPALVLYHGIALVTALPDSAVQGVRGAVSAYVVLTVALGIGHLLNEIGNLYVQRDPERARTLPIKGYLQVFKILTYLCAVILMVAIVFRRDPMLLLSGLGALTAVLMLVFKDTILSLVASVQLSSNDMLRVNDWIAMPQLNADGYVVDISLNTVKVQNWDKTITTIPTWRLISESYINWRGMFDAGGRRIKRSVYLDQTSVRFLTDAECTRLGRFTQLRGHLERKLGEIDESNKLLLTQGKDRVNSRRLTNLGTFRAYLQAYVEAHPGIHPEMFRLVRQLQPGATGVPLELYCYTSKTGWADYEGIQADIFDHIYAILPEFGLRVFQQPSGSDLVHALVRATGGEHERRDVASTSLESMLASTPVDT